MNPTISAHILFFNEDKVLLVKHGEKAGHITGIYGIPGGRQNPGETLLQTAVREFKEETGLTVAVKDLIDFSGNCYTADILRKDGNAKKYTMYVYIAKKAKGELTSSLEAVPEWINFQDLDKIELLPNVIKAIDDSRKKI